MKIFRLAVYFAWKFHIHYCCCICFLVSFSFSFSFWNRYIRILFSIWMVEATHWIRSCLVFNQKSISHHIRTCDASWHWLEQHPFISTVVLLCSLYVCVDSTEMGCHLTGTFYENVTRYRFGCSVWIIRLCERKKR